MDGDVDLIEGDVLGLLKQVYENLGPSATIEGTWLKALEGLRYAFRRLYQVNTAARAKRNVQHHYDLSGELYRLFLDEDTVYSATASGSMPAWSMTRTWSLVIRVPGMLGSTEPEAPCTSSCPSGFSMKSLNSAAAAGCSADDGMNP